MSKGAAAVCTEAYYAVSPFLLFPDTMADFAVYYRQGGNIVLYLKEKERYTRDLQQRLVEGGIREIYVRFNDRKRHAQYVESHLGDVLSDDSISVQERARIFRDTAGTAVREVFESCSGDLMDDASLQRVEALVKASVHLLSNEEGLRRVSSLVSHDYKTFSHSLHVYAYATAMFARLGMKNSELSNAATGAMLHDIGKTRIDPAILNKHGPLSSEEWELMRRHPQFGIVVVSRLPLALSAHHAILFHHERFEGGGYPAGSKKEEIPLVARVVTLCDVYDALTSERPYAPAEKPFDALRIMKEQMTGHFDLELFKLFIHVLSAAKLV